MEQYYWPPSYFWCLLWEVGMGRLAQTVTNQWEMMKVRYCVFWAAAGHFFPKRKGVEKSRVGEPSKMMWMVSWSLNIDKSANRSQGRVNGRIAGTNVQELSLQRIGVEAGAGMILLFIHLLFKSIRIWLFVFNDWQKPDWLTVKCFPFAFPKYTSQLWLETRLVCFPFYKWKP